MALYRYLVIFNREHRDRIQIIQYSAEYILDGEWAILNRNSLQIFHGAKNVPLVSGQYPPSRHRSARQGKRRTIVNYFRRVNSSILPPL